MFESDYPFYVGANAPLVTPAFDPGMMAFVGPVTDQTAMFDQLGFASWETVPLPFDPTKISFLEFQVATGTQADYDLCVANIQLVDAEGNVVAIPK